MNDEITNTGKDAITQQIIGAALEISNALGHGFLEAVYRKALMHELQLRGLTVNEEVAFKVHYKGAPVGRYVADLVVADRIIVEIKAVDCILPVHVSQTPNYLNASGLQIGLLLNFGTSKVGIRRIVR
ncbi:MAG TPA: GxxExxY protein [Azospirillum sp.]|nr:GxxExxY protein [Azospirillum sp.]